MFRRTFPSAARSKTRQVPTAKSTTPSSVLCTPPLESNVAAALADRAAAVVAEDIRTGAVAGAAVRAVGAMNDNDDDEVQ